LVDDRGYVAKAHTICMFSNLCSSCYRKTQCVNASAMNLCPKQYLLSITHHKRADVEGRLAFGTLYHEKAEAGIPSISDYDPEEFFRDLLSGKKIVIKEVPLCNPSIGLRGHPDILIFKYYPKRRHLFIRIEEIKTGFMPSYILQLTTYAMILSTPDALIHFDDKKSAYKLYPDPNITVTIQGAFRIYSGGRVQESPYWFINRGVPTKFFENMTKAVLKKRKDLLRFHSPGLYVLSELKYPSNCPLVAKKGREKPCGFVELCSRYPYTGSKQLYFGKRKLLIKTRPRIKSQPMPRRVTSVEDGGFGGGFATLDRFVSK